MAAGAGRASTISAQAARVAPWRRRRRRSGSAAGPARPRRLRTGGCRCRRRRRRPPDPGPAGVSMTAATAAIPDANTRADPPSSPPSSLLERLPGRIAVPAVGEPAALMEGGAQHHGRVDRAARRCPRAAGPGERRRWTAPGPRCRRCSLRTPPPGSPGGPRRMAATSKRMTAGRPAGRSRCSRSHRAASRRIRACLVGPTASAGTPNARPGTGLDLAEHERAPERRRPDPARRPGSASCGPGSGSPDPGTRPQPGPPRASRGRADAARPPSPGND